MEAKRPEAAGRAARYTAAQWQERLPVEVLRQRLDYDPATGLFVWRDDPALDPRSRRRLAGKPALTAKRKGYFGGSVAGVQVSAHRVAWAISYGVWPDRYIDHLNHDPADNRLANLRLLDPRGNARHRTLRGRRGSLGVLGVSRRAGRFYARIADGLRQRHLGAFDRIEDAVAARLEAETALGYPPRSETLAQAQAAAAEAWRLRCHVSGADLPLFAAARQAAPVRKGT